MAGNPNYLREFQLEKEELKIINHMMGDARILHQLIQATLSNSANLYQHLARESKQIMEIEREEKSNLPTKVILRAEQKEVSLRDETQYTIKELLKQLEETNKFVKKLQEQGKIIVKLNKKIIADLKSN